MSTTPSSPIGKCGWIDLAVADAESIRSFYEAVAGWTSSPVSMGDYSDYNMLAADGTPVAGVCHHRGVNQDFPEGRWMVYFTVANLDVALAQCRERGGQVKVGPKQMGPSARFAVIEDPAGAVCGLYESA